MNGWIWSYFNILPEITYLFTIYDVALLFVNVYIGNTALQKTSFNKINASRKNTTDVNRSKPLVSSWFTSEDDKFLPNPQIYSDRQNNI